MRATSGDWRRPAADVARGPRRRRDPGLAAGRHRERPRARLAYLLGEHPARAHPSVLRLVSGLRGLGIDVHLASLDPPPGELSRLSAEDRLEARGAWVVDRAGAGAAIARWMDRQGLAHLHAHAPGPALEAALAAARIVPIGVSVTVRGPEDLGAAGGSLAEQLDTAAFVCCPDRFARSQVMKLWPAERWPRIEIAPAGVDLAHFAPRPFRMGGDPFEVVSVGRLVPANGQHVLVAAVARLVKEDRDVRLRLVGDGPDRASLEDAVDAANLRGRVIFEGVADRIRLRALYASADAFALASLAERLPTALMEAMAMETPAIAPFIAGIPELIRPGQDGLLVAPGDEEELSAAVASLIDDTGLRRRLGSAGRRRVVERHDLDRCVIQLAEILSRRVGELA